MFSELDLGGKDQDKVVYLMLFDTSFLMTCVRKKIASRLFSSEVRQRLVDIVLEYYTNYQRAPAEDIVELISLKIKSGRIREEDLDMYSAYLDKVCSQDESEISADFLIDRIESFMKKRIASTAISSLIKLRDRLGIEPDRCVTVMREAIRDIDSMIGRQVVESFVEDSSTELDLEVTTRFNIANIDESLGGGLRRGQLVVILGFINIGKSWSITHLAKMAARLGRTCLIISIEMANKLLKIRLKMCLTGMTKNELARDKSAAKSIIETSMVRGSDIILLSDDESNLRVDGIPSVLEEIEKKYSHKPRLILIDSADDLLPPEGMDNYKPIERSKAVYTWLKNYAKDNDICIVTTTQAQRRGEKTYWMTAGYVGDDINKLRKATVGISLNATKDEIDAGYVRLYLFKNTDGPVGAKAWALQDFRRGQFICDKGKFNYIEYKEILKEAGIGTEDEES